MPGNAINVLLVEDNPADARLLTESLKDAGADAFRVTHVSRMSAAEEQLGRDAVDVVLLDLSLPDCSGLETVLRVQEAAPLAPIVVLTGLRDESLALQAVRQGVQDYLVKGQCEGDLTVRAIRYAIERRRTDEALRSAERQVRTIVDAVPALIGYIDRDARFRLTNQAYETWFGYRREDMIGRHMSEVLGRAAWEKLRPRIERALAGAPVHFDDQIPFERGGSRWVSGTYTPDRDPRDGRVRGVVILVTDVSAMKQAEEAVRRSESQLRTVMDNLPVGVVFTAASGEIVFGNPAAARIWGGLRHVDASRYDVYKGWWPETGRRLRACDWSAARVLREGEPVIGEVVDIECFDGARKTISNSAVPMRDATGTLTGALVIIEDVTDRRRAERAFRENASRLSAVVSTAVDAIITIDERGTIDTVNEATERLFGYAREELVGRNVAMLMPEPYAGEHDGYLQRYLRTGEARIIGIGRDVIGLRKDGTTFPVTLSVSEFELAGRRMFTGILHDISNRRRLEREILEASAAEQRRIGHDLHDGLCQQILGASFGFEVLGKRLERSAPSELPALHKLQELLNDTLNQARALSHGLNPIDVRAGGLAKALHNLSVRVTDAFHVDCSFREQGPVEVADSTTAINLYRIAQEAISNAIKHGGARRIDMELAVSGDGHLTLTITDDGRGFPATPNPRAGRGLQIMQYRAGIIGATLTVRAGDPGGVVVTCSLRTSAIATTTDVPPAASTHRAAAAPASPRRTKKPASRKRRR